MKLLFLLCFFNEWKTLMNLCSFPACFFFMFVVCNLYHILHSVAAFAGPSVFRALRVFLLVVCECKHLC